MCLSPLQIGKSIQHSTEKSCRRLRLRGHIRFCVVFTSVLVQEIQFVCDKCIRRGNVLALLVFRHWVDFLRRWAKFRMQSTYYCAKKSGVKLNPLISFCCRPILLKQMDLVVPWYFHLMLMIMLHIASLLVIRKMGCVKCRTTGRSSHCHERCRRFFSATMKSSEYVRFTLLQ